MLKLLVTELSRHLGDPFGRWGDIATAITIDEVLNCTPLNEHREGYVIDFSGESSERNARIEHCQRIKYLMENPNWDPIFLDQDWKFGTVILDDGHHRLCAAVILKHKTINVCYNGMWRDFRAAFPTSYRRGLIRQKLWY